MNIIQSNNWEGRTCALFPDNLIRGPMTEGETVLSFRGETFTLNGGQAPHKPGSSGRVWVTDQDGGEHEYFPGVFDLTWRTVNPDTMEKVL